MKIGLLTFVGENSFGANLQCYALSRVLARMGHDVVLVDFRLPAPHSRLAGRLADLVPTLQRHLFSTRFMPPFTRRVTCRAELCSAAPDVDCYVVGSDQVWNTDITKEAAPAFFLDFVPKGTRRISYAASFGVTTWRPTPHDDVIRRALLKFDAISVRERSGLRLLDTYFGVSGEAVLDPTLLLEDYSELVAQQQPLRRELISFRLAPDSRYMEQIADLSKRMGLTPVLLNHRRFRRGFRVRPFPGIRGWLDSLAHGSFIVTDSFHCMVFAILFRKDFVVIPSHPGRTSRMTDLLGKLGIEGRFFPDLTSARFDRLQPIAYDQVHEKLEAERAHSRSFLTRALDATTRSGHYIPHAS